MGDIINHSLKKLRQLSSLSCTFWVKNLLINYLSKVLKVSDKMYAPKATSLERCLISRLPWLTVGIQDACSPPLFSLIG